MMSNKAGFLICSLSFLIVACMPALVSAQEEMRPGAKTRDGSFEITLKTAGPALKLRESELVRDRGLDPLALYRVRTGGYIAFDESEFVEKIEFKVFLKEVTEFTDYRKVTAILVDINNKMTEIRNALDSYDQLALRLMNICDKSRFPSLQAIDENIVQQLTVYQKLLLLRDLVVNSLNRFVRDRSCEDRRAEYQKSLELYTRQLADLSQNYDRLNRRGIQLAQDLKSTAGEPPESKKTEEQPPPPPLPPGRR
jgi:hypothetical protein